MTRILYAGDSEVGGPANYLLGILKFLKARVTHVPPGKILRPSFFKTNRDRSPKGPVPKRYDEIILSDFSKTATPPATQKIIAEQVKKGTGLLMIGGWASFSGPHGKWRGSLIEKFLPVRCLETDDRMNLPGGAWLIRKERHPAIEALDFKNPPVICGLNRVRPRAGSQTLLTGRSIADGKEFPLLVVGENHGMRTAALATDLAPHWCGGLVDCGRKRLRLPVKGKIQIEVGETYVRFVSRLVSWLAKS